jgi:outer membrane lipoprotein-sorting protein
MAYPDTDRDDDQWIYLPAARKVRRISASKKGDYFMGTDFTYDDIKKEGKAAEGEYTHNTVGTEAVDGHFCYKIESIPVGSKIEREIGYSRIVQWIDPENWMARKFQMWDIRGNELKTIYFKDITQIDGIWTALLLEAENHKTGHRSIFRFSDIRYNQPVDDKLFKKESMKRGIQ